MKRMTATVLVSLVVISIAIVGAEPPTSNYFYVVNDTGDVVFRVSPTGMMRAAENITTTKYVIGEYFWDVTDGIEWIKPEHILDVDDADIESDLNTYWDIAGEEVTGSYHYNFTNSNLTIDYACFNDDCSTYIFYNGTNLIMQG